MALNLEGDLLAHLFDLILAPFVLLQKVINWHRNEITS